MTYRATAETLAKEAEITKKRRVKLIGMPRDFANITWDDVLLDDANRVAAYQAVAEFIADYPNQNGVYL